jgi:hypothetical protein
MDLPFEPTDKIFASGAGRISVDKTDSTEPILDINSGCTWYIDGYGSNKGYIVADKYVYNSTNTYYVFLSGTICYTTNE